MQPTLHLLFQGLMNGALTRPQLFDELFVFRLLSLVQPLYEANLSLQLAHFA